MDSHLNSYLAGKLRSFRKQAGFTQAELADKIGRIDETISNIERGKSLPSIETLVAIAATLELPLRDFFPSTNFDDSVSMNRLNKEAEMMALIRTLNDKELDIALMQITALANT